MTSNTPDHEARNADDGRIGHDGHDASGHDAYGHDGHGHDAHSHDAYGHDDSAPEGDGVPVEPVQPASAADVYDDGPRDAAVTDPSAGFAAEDREPYPIGATDAEPAPATAGAHDDIVIDYGSAQDPEPVSPTTGPSGDAHAAAEPPLTKPSPAEEQHPYPPQALGEPAAGSTGSAGAAGLAGGAGVAAAAAASDRDADRDRDGDRDARPTDRVEAASSADASSRPVYVQAPTPPKTKGNRGFGIAIGILATLVFGALYLLALVFVVTPFSTPGSQAAPTTALLDTVSSPVFYVPVIVFFLAWALLVVILTRAAWWGYVIGGFLVGLLTYAGYLGGILAVNAFEVAPSQVPQFLLEHLLDAPALLAFIIAREIPIWFGVLVGKRGRSVRARNAEAREEYERILEAGPAARS